MTQVSVCQGEGIEPPTKFKKGVGLDRTLTFRGGVAGKEGGDFSGRVQLSHNKLKSETFDDKKSLISKNIFLCNN